MDNSLRLKQPSTAARGRPAVDVRTVFKMGIHRKRSKQVAIETWEDEGGSVIDVTHKRQTPVLEPDLYSYAFPARWARLSPLIG